MNRTPVSLPRCLAVGQDHGLDERTSAAGLLREVRPDDADAIRAFLCDLSPRSQYYRFFASVAPPSTVLLQALCGARGSADILLLTDDHGAIIAHAMAADQAGPDGPAANIGLVVADRWQGHGIGTLLLSTLVGRAVRRGVRGLVLDILPANTRMLGIIARRWPDAPREHTPDAIVIQPVIGQPPTSVADVPGLVRLR